MFSELAKNDLIALRQKGFHPTDEDVVKLNDIAIRLERGKETTPVNAPRVAFAGNIILHEPTIGALKWWHDFGRDSAQSDETRLLTYFFMSAHATNLDVLSSLESADDIREAVYKWASTIEATENEMWRALMYVKFGTESQLEDAKTQVDDTLTDDDAMERLWIHLIAAAGTLHLSPEDLKTSTRSELLAMLVHARLFTQSPLKISIAEDYIRYSQLLKAIENRETEGKDDGQHS